MNEPPYPTKELLAQTSEIKLEKTFLNILDQDETNYDALVGVTELYKDIKNYDKAFFYGNKITKFHPEKAFSFLLVGTILLAKKNYNNAITYINKAISMENDITGGYYYLGLCYQYLEDYNRCKEFFQKSVETDPKASDALYKLGCIYFQEDNIDVALDFFKKANHVDNNSEKTKQSLAHIETIRGNYKEAIKYYQQILKYNPTCASAMFGIATIKKYKSSGDQDIKTIIQTLDHHPKETEDEYNLHYALGKIYDDLKNYDQAFFHYKEANNLYESSLNHINNMFLDNFSEKEYLAFDKKFFMDRAGFGCQSAKPFFILGQPRSGTSLLSNILSNHSKVKNAGELDKISTICLNFFNSKRLYNKDIANSNLVSFVQHLTKEDVSSFANDYLKEVERLVTAQHVIDKMPNNYIYIGLIKLIFPNAKIIHCQRHPVDTCLSMFFQKFQAGQMDYTCNLDIIIKYYKEYISGMKIFNEALPGFIHNIRYEQVINDPKKQISNLLKFCELEWEDTCLNYQTNKQLITTASSWQARQPIYKSSSGRWKNYKQHIGPLIKSLENEIKTYEFQCQ